MEVYRYSGSSCKRKPSGGERGVRNWSWPLREVAKTTILEQDPPNNKIDGGFCLQPLPHL